MVEIPITEGDFSLAVSVEVFVIVVPGCCSADTLISVVVFSVGVLGPTVVVAKRGELGMASEVAVARVCSLV